MFKKMLLDALHKAPPRTVDDLAIFFERSRERLEQSLDKGQVSGEERTRYLSQFQAGLNEAQVEFLNNALEVQSESAAREASGEMPPSEGGMLPALLFSIRQPVMWLVFVLVLLVGLLIGVLLGSQAG